MEYTNESHKSHNGKITIENPETGGWRTFEIRTQKADASFAPGKRVVSLLTGSNNDYDYTGFGFINGNGIALWNRQKGWGEFETYVKMIERPEAYQARGIIYRFEEKCRICNRTLTTPESIERGIGPVCAAKI